MSNLSLDEIKKIASLANLELSDEELSGLSKDLSKTLTHVSDLDELNLKDVSPSYQVSGLTNVLREDVVTSSLTQEEALQNSKSKNGYFVTKVKWT